MSKKSPAFDLNDILLGKISAFVNVKLSNDQEISSLNKKHFKRDYTTDVLSFSMDEVLEDGTIYLGDVIVNVEQAQRQSKEYGNGIKQEISELVEHGVLHILGVHHSDDDEHTVHGVSKEEIN